MKAERTASMIGLAMKAGKVSAGEFVVEKSVKEGRSFLVIIAADASDNTKKKFRDMCAYYEVRTIEAMKKDELGHAIGREQRACISINDHGFAEAINKKAKEQEKTK